MRIVSNNHRHYLTMFPCRAGQDTLGEFYLKGLGVVKVKIDQVANVITYGWLLCRFVLCGKTKYNNFTDSKTNSH